MNECEICLTIGLVIGGIVFYLLGNFMGIVVYLVLEGIFKNGKKNL